MTRIGRTSVKYTNDEAGMGLVWRKHGELVNDYLFPRGLTMSSENVCAYHMQSHR